MLFLFLIISKSYAFPNEAIQSSAMDSNILYKISTSESATKKLIFSKSFDFGQTFTIPETIIDSIEGCSDFVIIPSQKILNVFWTKNNKLYKSKSLDAGIIFSPSQEILSFFSSPINLKIITDNQQKDFFHIFWQDEKKALHYLQLLPNNSMTYNILNPPAISVNYPIISLSNNHIFIAWQNPNSKIFYFEESFDNGIAWKKLSTLDFIPSSAKYLNIKEFGPNIYASWMEEDKNLIKTAFSFKPISSSIWMPPKYIYSSDQKIRSLNMEISDLGGIFLFHQYKNVISAVKSLNYGASWENPYDYPVPNIDNEGAINFYLRKAGATVKTSDNKFTNLENAAPQIPLFLTKDNLKTNVIQPIIETASLESKDIGKANYFLSFCPYKSFDQSKTLFIPIMNNGFKIPWPLSDGIYYYKLSAWDGIDISNSQVQSLIIDTSIPRILDIRGSNKFFLGAFSSGEAKFQIVFDKSMDIEQASNEAAIALSNRDKISVSSNKTKWLNENILSASFMVNKYLPDGIYKLSISNILDSAGNTFTSTNEYSCLIDQTPPQLYISYPEDNFIINKNNLTISGSIEIDPLYKTELFINSKKELFDSSGRFAKSISLKEGVNLITFEAFDAAQNKATITRTIHYLKPLDIIKPAKESFVKSGSTILIEAQITDLSSEFEDETQAEAKLNSKDIESSLFYDKTSNKILGFIKIPENFISLENILSISIPDSNSVIKEGACQIKIDDKAPEIGLELFNNSYFSNDINKLEIPIVDKESGPDLKNSTILIFSNGTSVEGKILINKNNNSIIFTTKIAFIDSKYSAKAILRDIAGNISKAKEFNLEIDTTLPHILLTSNLPAQTTNPEISITGTVDKTLIKSLSIQINSQKPQNVQLKNNSFNAIVSLSKGQNNIRISAVDFAQNSSALPASVFYNAPPDAVFFKFDDKIIQNGDFAGVNSSIKIVDEKGTGISDAKITLDSLEVSYNENAGLVSAPQLSIGEHIISLEKSGKIFSEIFIVENSLKINNLSACPNPYNPASQNAAISFNVSKNSTVKIYLFNLAGNLIWQKSVSSGIGYNEVPWDGKNINGEIVSNGVYIVKIASNDPEGNRAYSKSKLIVLR